MTRLQALVAAGSLVVGAGRASAQSAPFERGYVSVGADLFAAGPSFTDVVHPIDFAEPATVATTYPLTLAPGFTVGGGMHVWRRLSIGLEAGRTSKANDSAISAQVPHPFFFGQPRSVSGTAGLQRDETAVHVVATWIAPIARRWQLAAGGGPSWLNVDQELVQDVTVTQAYPYDTATYAGVVTQRAEKWRLGINSGIEVTYLVSPYVGLSVGARYSYAHVPLSATASTAAGGFHMTAGVRLRFQRRRLRRR